MFSTGNKVNYRGACYIVAEVLGSNAKVYQARHNRNAGPYRAIVPVDQLTPWTPAPKVSAHAKTCQICARAIHAGTGMIAHHGYERPGRGWQTASCMGARELPFEVSRDALGRWIESVKVWLVDADKRALELPTTTATLFRDEEVKDERGHTLYLGHGRSARKVTKAVGYKPGHPLYPKLLAAAIARNEADRKRFASEVKEQTKRYSEWKPAGL